MDPVYLFNNGKNYQSYLFLGAHAGVWQDRSGYFFRVWAPHARSVALMGDFNHWYPAQDPMKMIGTSGIWQIFREHVHPGDRYQYLIEAPSGKQVAKADPFGCYQEVPPQRASVIFESQFEGWTDQSFRTQLLPGRSAQALNIYEVHLGSWRRRPDGQVYNYREIADQLADYCSHMNYNAIEIMPIMEHPLEASWGYQVTGYFAPTARYGTPDDFKYMVNRLHQAGLRVILDWVPAHFPRDAFGLYHFDGGPCFEPADSRIASKEDWGTQAFDYAKAEVRSFLMSNAYYWFDEFHVDGLRFDAVSYMIYLNYGSRQNRQLVNRNGGNDNLEAIDFIKELNQLLITHFPYALLFAEEATAFPGVTQTVDQGGLGFTHKWNMGWMHDSLDYMSVDYYARSRFHEKITFSLTYAMSENYILPLSHDEVVHGKKSLIGRMPGDIWRQCASLRVCFAWQFTHPGAKLNFMGNEFGQFVEWRFYEELEWFMLKIPHHEQLQNYSQALNHFYLSHPALYEDSATWQGFQWIQANDRQNSVFAFLRHASSESLLVILNMTPAVINDYRFFVPQAGKFTLLFNSDDGCWGGSSFLGPVVGKLVVSTQEENIDNQDDVGSTESPRSDNFSDKVEIDKNAPQSTLKNEIWPALYLDIPPLAAMIFRFDKY